jgi:hypothetical protein
MKIELRNVKLSAFMSRETHCFQAVVYIDGKRSSVVENDGQGGCDCWHDRDVQARVEAYARTLPPAIGGNNPLPMSAEILIGNLLNQHIRAQALKRALAKRIVFTRDGSVYETRTLPRADLTRLLADPQINEKLKATKVLNTLPFQAALELYANTGA